MLRKENEILILRTKLSILKTIHNTVVSLSFIPESDKTISQKLQLIELYEKQTKNKINKFVSLTEFLEKIKSSVGNFENNISKLEKQISSSAEKEIINGFDIITSVAVQLQMPINVNKISVAEFISYKKLAQKKQKQNGER
jgi:hypothetical protein